MPKPRYKVPHKTNGTDRFAHIKARERVMPLEPEKVRAMKEALAKDLANLKACNIAAAKGWSSMAFAVSIGELLALHLGICSDEESCRIIRAGGDLLADLHDRYIDRGTWAMRAEEREVLDLALERIGIQLGLVNKGEYILARDSVLHHNDRARAKNVPKGVRVPVKNLGH